MEYDVIEPDHANEIKFRHIKKEEDMDQIELTGKKYQQYELILNFKELVLNPNEYLSVIAISDGIEFFYRGINKPLKVKNYKRNFGYFTANHRWIVNYNNCESKK